MMIDIYTTPVMSDEPERVFGETSAAVDSRRRLLHTETIQWFMCVKSWTRSEITTLVR
jgi:hypothetical protein